MVGGAGDRLPALGEGADMTTTRMHVVPTKLDVTRLAVASFLARYREPTLTAYRQDVKAFLGWCQLSGLELLAVRRAELGM